MTQKQALLEQNYFTGRVSLLNPIHSFRACGCPEAFTTTTIFGNVVEKLARQGRNATSREHMRRSLTHKGAIENEVLTVVFSNESMSV